MRTRQALPADTDTQGKECYSNKCVLCAKFLLLIACVLCFSLFACNTQTVDVLYVSPCSSHGWMTRERPKETRHNGTHSIHIDMCDSSFTVWLTHNTRCIVTIYTCTHTEFWFPPSSNSHTKFSPGRWKTCFQIRAIKTPQNQIPQQTVYILARNLFSHWFTRSLTRSLNQIHSLTLVRSHLVHNSKSVNRNSLRSYIYALRCESLAKHLQS